jgi:DNA-3-methyladenine glycosylase
MTQSLHPLLKTFFQRHTVDVARDLLGQILRVQIPQASPTPRHFKIVETEAYTHADPACHAFGRTTGRAATLYKQPGLAYVYFIYGMYHCLNVVAAIPGQAGAVLFRGLEPLEPINLSHPVPPTVPSSNSKLLTNGLGKLCKHLHITKQHNEIDMTHPGSPLLLLPSTPVLDQHVTQTTRIGIRLATDYPWRFYVNDNPWVSTFTPPKRRKQPNT